MKTLSFCFLLLVFALLTQSQSCSNHGSSPDSEPYVVMLSLDAFRWDYPDKFETPNLDKLANHGVKANSLVPCFPSKTFPNHYSMITGLHPDHHGIVQNSFYDPDMDQFYSIGNRDAVENGDFYGGETIWATAEKQGIRTASYFWVGSEAAIQGMQPSIWKIYEHDFPFEARVDSVITWLQLPLSQRPRLITFYMHEPDSKGHCSGPDNPQLEETIIFLDSLVGDLIFKLSRLDIANQINLIVTSDHGMGPVSPEHYTDLAEHVKPNWVDIVIGYNPNFLIKATEEYYDSIVEHLDDIPHVSAWSSEEVPEYLVYGDHPRTLDFVFLADSAWSMGWQEKASARSHGAHGYDIRNTDMHAIFYACGPAFKSGVGHPSFQNTDIYPLLANILGITPADNDGNLENVSSMLKDVK